jgi:hypothetical protein
MLESGASGSVRGVLSNEHPYREPGPLADIAVVLNPRTEIEAKPRQWRQ